MVEIGRTVRFQVRDAETADEDLHALLDAHRESIGRVDGALLFSCNGRGSAMFGTADHDAVAVRDALGPIGVAGFFAAGEVGPGGRPQPRARLHRLHAGLPRLTARRGHPSQETHQLRGDERGFSSTSQCPACGTSTARTMLVMRGATVARTASSCPWAVMSRVGTRDRCRRHGVADVLVEGAVELEAARQGLGPAVGPCVLVDLGVGERGSLRGAAERRSAERDLGIEQRQVLADVVATTASGTRGWEWKAMCQLSVR